MGTNLKVSFPREKIATFCHRWKITEMSVFGSALREDFRPDSDIDLLVTFAPESHWTLFDMVDMRDELIGLLGRDVDLVSRRGVEASRNPIRRQAILSSARAVYAA